MKDTYAKIINEKFEEIYKYITKHILTSLYTHLLQNPINDEVK